jgi:hypothetical protein
MVRVVDNPRNPQNSPLRFSDNMLTMVDILKNRDPESRSIYHYLLNLHIDLDLAMQLKVEAIGVRINKSPEKTSPIRDVDFKNYIINVREYIERFKNKDHRVGFLYSENSKLYPVGLPSELYMPRQTEAEITYDSLGNYIGFRDETNDLSFFSSTRMPNVLRGSLSTQNFPFINRKNYAILGDSLPQGSESIFGYTDHLGQQISGISENRKKLILRNVSPTTFTEERIHCFQSSTKTNMEDISTIISIDEAFLDGANNFTCELFSLDVRNEILHRTGPEFINHSSNQSILEYSQDNPVLSYKQIKNGGCIIYAKQKNSLSPLELIRYTVSPVDFKLKAPEFISPSSTRLVNGFTEFKFIDSGYCPHPMFMVYKCFPKSNNLPITSCSSIIVPGNKNNYFRSRGTFGSFAKINCCNVDSGISINIDNISWAVREIFLMRHNIDTGTTEAVDRFENPGSSYYFLDTGVDQWNRYRYFYKYQVRGKVRDVSWKNSRSSSEITRVSLNRRVKTVPCALVSEIIDSNDAIKRVRIDFGMDHNDMPKVNIGAEYGVTGANKNFIKLPLGFILAYKVTRQLIGGSKEELGFVSGISPVIDDVRHTSGPLNIRYIIEPSIINENYMKRIVDKFKHPTYIAEGLIPSESDLVMGNDTGVVELFNRGLTGKSMTTTVDGGQNYTINSIVNFKVSQKSLSINGSCKKFNILSWSVTNQDDINFMFDYFVLLAAANGVEYIIGVLENPGGSTDFKFIDKKLSNFIGEVTYKIKPAFPNGKFSGTSDTVTVKNKYSINEALINFGDLTNAKPREIK